MAVSGLVQPTDRDGGASACRAVVGHARAMTVYVLADIDVHDPERYEDYKVLAGDAVERYGGRYAVRGGTVEVLEGEWPTGRFVVLEFPDAAAARRWYDSPEYTAARAVRQEASNARFLLVSPPGA
jgi:uncharacterized protein (DUF1330 family)